MALVGPPFAQKLEESSDAAAVEAFLRVARLLANHSEGWGAERPLPAVRASLVTRWSKDQYAEGAYSYLPVGASETAAPCPLARHVASSSWS